MLVDELLERDGHLLFDCAGVVDVARDAEKLSSRVAFAAERVEPLSSTANDGRGDSDRLDVRDRAGAAEETNSSRERRLQARLTRLALQGLNERCLLSANVCTHTAVEEHIEVIAGAAGILAEETFLVRFLNSTLKDSGLVVEFTANVDVRGGALESQSQSLPRAHFATAHSRSWRDQRRDSPQSACEDPCA